MKLLDKVTDDEFKKLVKSSHHMYELGDKIGYSAQSTYKISKELKSRMNKLGVSFSKEKVVDYSYYKKETYHGNIRRRVIEDNSIEYACSICGNKGIWNGKELVLQIDHINGDASNNELSNLRFLCPNCHTQTSTYGNKNKITRTKHDRHSHYNRICKYCGKEFVTNGNRQIFCSPGCASKSRTLSPSVSYETLLYEVSNYGFVGTGKIHNVSDNSIRKWCKKVGLPTNSKYYKEYKSKSIK